jgi:hypothetical protein
MTFAAKSAASPTRSKTEIDGPNCSWSAVTADNVARGRRNNFVISGGLWRVAAFP